MWNLSRYVPSAFTAHPAHSPHSSVKTRSSVFVTRRSPRSSRGRQRYVYCTGPPKTALTRQMLSCCVLNYVSSFRDFLNSNYYRRKRGSQLQRKPYLSSLQDLSRVKREESCSIEFHVNFYHVKFPSRRERSYCRERLILFFFFFSSQYRDSESFARGGASRARARARDPWLIRRRPAGSRSRGAHSSTGLINGDARPRARYISVTCVKR